MGGGGAIAAARVPRDSAIARVIHFPRLSHVPIPCHINMGLSGGSDLQNGRIRVAKTEAG